MVLNIKPQPSSNTAPQCEGNLLLRHEMSSTEQDTEETEVRVRTGSGPLMTLAVKV